MAIPERYAHLAFVVGMVFKAIDGLLELLGAIALLFITRSRIDQWANMLEQQELGGGLANSLAGHLAHAAHHFNGGTQHFAVIYLFGHGAIKLVLVAGLLRGVRWVFPVALAVLTGFVAYQLYRLSVTVSWVLVAVTVIDVIVIALIWHEWRYTGSRGGNR